jgi:hypothetical protein
MPWASPGGGRSVAPRPIGLGRDDDTHEDPPMTKPTSPAPVAVNHAGHSAALFACPHCRRASEGTISQRIYALRARR